MESLLKPICSTALCTSSPAFPPEAEVTEAADVGRGEEEEEVEGLAETVGMSRVGADGAAVFVEALDTGAVVGKELCWDALSPDPVCVKDICHEVKFPLFFPRCFFLPALFVFYLVSVGIVAVSYTHLRAHET